jgi:hypothetical protein
MASFTKTMEELYTLQVLFDIASGSTNLFDVPIAAAHEDNWIRKLGLERFTEEIVKTAEILSGNNRLDVLAHLGVAGAERQYNGTEFIFAILETITYDPAADPGEKLYFHFRINDVGAGEEESILVLVTVGLSHSINR